MSGKEIRDAIIAWLAIFSVSLILLAQAWTVNNRGGGRQW